MNGTNNIWIVKPAGLSRGRGIEVFASLIEILDNCHREGQWVAQKYMENQTAEEIKIKLGSALELEKKKKMEISGRDQVFGLPRTVEVTSDDITEAILPTLMQIIGTVKAVLEDTPPELAADIIDKGIVMSGGTSMLKNLDKLLTEETGVPAHVAEDALFCVVRGTGIVMENIELWKRSVTTKRS